MVTLGIYGFVWLIRVNRDARGFLGDSRIKPNQVGVSLIVGLFIFPLTLLVLFQTAQRVRDMERRAQCPDPSNPWLALLAMFGLGFGFFYMQSHLNRVAAAVQGSAG